MSAGEFRDEAGTLLAAPCFLSNLKRHEPIGATTEDSDKRSDMKTPAVKISI